MAQERGAVSERTRSRRQGRQVSALHRARRLALVGAYWLVLLFSVLSYGANTALSLTSASSAAFLLLLLAFMVEGEPSTCRKPFWIAFGLLCALPCWAWVQTLPWPGGVETAIWRNVAAFSDGSPPSASAASGDAVLGLLKVALPIGMLLSAFILFDREEQAIFAFKCLAVVGGVTAILGLLQFLLLPGFLVFEPKLFYQGSLTGSFVNRNTAGTFFGVVSIMLLALALHAAAKIDRHRLLRLLDRGGRLEQPKDVATAAAFGSLFLIALSAEFLTNSRAAIGITAVSLVLMVLLFTFRPKRRPSIRRRRAGWRQKFRRMAIAGLLVCVPLLVFSALSSRVQQRFDEAGGVDPRFCALHAISSATAHYWPEGAGLTRFQEVYPAYRDPACGVNGIWDKAHNFYLEGLFSLGIFFPAALCLSAAVIGRTLMKGFSRRKSRYYIVAAGFCVTLLVAVHAAFDFSLQIPGFAVFFAAVLAPVMTICRRQPAKPAPGTPVRERQQSRPDR